MHICAHNVFFNIRIPIKFAILDLQVNTSLREYSPMSLVHIVILSVFISETKLHPGFLRDISSLYGGILFTAAAVVASSHICNCFHFFPMFSKKVHR